MATNDEPLNYVERQIEQIINHPSYHPLNGSNLALHDIGLIKLKKPIEFQPNIIPICLPQDGAVFDEETAWITGWGRLGNVF